MKCYTNHGESLQVHNYIGMDVDEAIEKAKSKSFTIVVNDSIFVVGKEPNTILEQHPKPLARVKEKRTIYVMATKAEADEIILPNLKGGNDDFMQYSRKLSRYDVKANILTRQFDNKLEENTILEVIYKGDTITNKLNDTYKVNRGSTVDFIVSERGGSSVPIPDLVCQKFEAAQFLISNYNLNIGSVIEDKTVTDRLTAYVWRQQPIYSSRDKIRIGEQVNLYITQNRPDNCPLEENLTDYRQAAPKKPIQKKTSPSIMNPSNSSNGIEEEIIEEIQETIETPIPIEETPEPMPEEQPEPPTEDNGDGFDDGFDEEDLEEDPFGDEVEDDGDGGF